MKITVSTGMSGNKKSAESKKCRKLEEISLELNMELRVRMGKILKAIKRVDLELGKVLTDVEIDQVVVSGMRPGKGKKGGVVIEVDV